MNAEERLFRDLWMAEMWAAVPELSREEREVQRALAQPHPQPAHDTPVPRKKRAA